MKKVVFTENVYTYHIDFACHVSNIVYIKRMEIGRLKLLEAIGMPVHEINVLSLKTGLRSWNDSEYPLVNSKQEQLPLEKTDIYFIEKISPEQLGRQT